MTTTRTQRILADRALRQSASPLLKTLERLERKLTRHEAWVLRRHFYEGAHINYPRVGQALVHTRGADGVRRSILITSSGEMVRYPAQVVTAAELLADGVS